MCLCHVFLQPTIDLGYSYIAYTSSFFAFGTPACCVLGGRMKRMTGLANENFMLTLMCLLDARIVVSRWSYQVNHYMFTYHSSLHAPNKIQPYIYIYNYLVSFKIANFIFCCTACLFIWPFSFWSVDIACKNKPITIVIVNITCANTLLLDQSRTAR